MPGRRGVDAGPFLRDMTLLLFIVISVLVGGLLYLPFLLWFRRRRPRAGSVLSARVAYTPAGWLLLVAELATMFAGIEFHDPRSGNAFTRLFEGNAGVLRWWVCIVVAFSGLAWVLRGAGIALEHPPAISATPSPPGAPAMPPRRYKVATILGIPIYIQRSYLYGGLFLALIAETGPAGIAGYCVAYAVLFALHEIAHAVTARGLGLKVHAINLSAIGGTCVVQLPRRPRDAWAVYSAGLVVQAALLVVTLAIVALHGDPASSFGSAIVTTFIWINAVVLLVNLLPGRTAMGGRTDGDVLWGLARHAFRGDPHPLAAQMAASPVFDPSTNLLERADLIPEGFRDGIAFYNDDTTPMEFVVEILHRHAGLDPEAASASMLAIHRHGGLLLPMSSREAATATAAAIAHDARERGHHLVCKAVSVDA